MKSRTSLQSGSQESISPVNLAKEIDDWLLKSQNLRGVSKKPRTKFWPSELAYCDREIYHRWKNQHKGRYKPVTLRMLEDGSVAEGRITRYLKEMGLLISTQESLPDNPYFSGKVDHIYMLDGQKYINEFKRVNNNSFLRLKTQRQPSFAHEVQINVYLWAFKLGMGTILYENRDSAELLCFLSRKNENILKWTFEKIAKLRSYIDNDIEPPRCRSTGRWICPYCYPANRDEIEDSQKYEALILKPRPESVGILGWMDSAQDHTQPKI